MRFRLCCAALLLTGTPSAARGQDSALTRAYAGARLPITEVNGRLQGEGGARLIEAVRSAQYVLVGEEHGVAQVPRLVRALLEVARPLGFSRLVIEVSPVQAERLNALARTPAPRQGLNTLFSRWLDAMPFYTLREEADLLGWAPTPLGSAKSMQII